MFVRCLHISTSFLVVPYPYGLNVFLYRSFSPMYAQWLVYCWSALATHVLPLLVPRSGVMVMDGNNPSGSPSWAHIPWQSLGLMKEGREYRDAIWCDDASRMFHVLTGSYLCKNVQVLLLFPDGSKNDEPQWRFLDRRLFPICFWSSQQCGVPWFKRVGIATYILTTERSCKLSSIVSLKSKWEGIGFIFFNLLPKEAHPKRNNKKPGIRFGHRKWPGSHRTLLGTMAFVFSVTLAASIVCPSTAFGKASRWNARFAPVRLCDCACNWISVFNFRWWWVIEEKSYSSRFRVSCRFRVIYWDSIEA